nr:hypothetical protein [Tessaracoccus coleopterorum]
MFSSFIYFGTDGTVCNNSDFGSFEVTSEDPLTVKYTISDEAVWSDGTPVTINDYLLDWAAQNPEFLVPGYANGEDPEAKAVFDHVSSSFAEYVLNGPEGEVGGKTFTVVYKEAYPDFKLMIGSALPAHVAATKSGLTPRHSPRRSSTRTPPRSPRSRNSGTTAGCTTRASFLTSPRPRRPALQAQGGRLDRRQLPDARDQRQVLGYPAGTENLIFRFIEDAGMAQALQNGDLQVISPSRPSTPSVSSRRSVTRSTSTPSRPSPGSTSTSTSAPSRMRRRTCSQTTPAALRCVRRSPTACRVRRSSTT